MNFTNLDYLKNYKMLCLVFVLPIALLLNSVISVANLN